MNVKNAKKTLALVALFLVALTGFTSSADNQSSNKSPNGETILTTNNNDTYRKRMPSRNVLVVRYSDGMLSLSSDYCEGEFAITFENCEASESYEIPTMAVGESAILYLPSGEYNVTAVDSEGRTFSGCLILQ